MEHIREEISLQLRRGRSAYQTGDGQILNYLSKKKKISEHPIFSLENERLEPENHLFENENLLNQTFIFMFHVNFHGCIMAGKWSFAHSLGFMISLP